MPLKQIDKSFNAPKAKSVEWVEKSDHRIESFSGADCVYCDGLIGRN